MIDIIKEMLQYDFMVRAFIVAGILAVLLPCVGLPIILKRLSMMGDTLSHSSLAGVALGLCFGFNQFLREYYCLYNSRVKC